MRDNSELVFGVGNESKPVFDKPVFGLHGSTSVSVPLFVPDDVRTDGVGTDVVVFSDGWASIPSWGFESVDSVTEVCGREGDDLLG